MASPVETMESCCSEAGFQPARNPKKRPRGSSDTGPVSPRGERSSETPIETSIVTIKPVNAKQSMKKVIVNGLAVARELDRIAGGSVAKVSSRANANYIVVTAHNNKQAKSMTSHTKFGGIDVAITLGKPSFSIKGVIMGIPHDVEDKEIQDYLKSQGITAAKRIMKRVSGQLQKTTAILLSFSKKMPESINFGYEKKRVRPYVPPVIRCFKCQQYGHGTDQCHGRVRCPACSQGHEWKECPNKSAPKCARCGGAHSAAYMGCPKYKEAKQAQIFKVKERVSYSDALKAVRKLKSQTAQVPIGKDKEATKATEPPKNLEPLKTHEPPKTSTDPSKAKGQEKRGSQKSRIPTRPTQKANTSISEGPVQPEKAPPPPKPKPTTKTCECQTDTPAPSLSLLNPDQFLALFAYIINGLDVNKSKSDRIKLVALAAEKCCGIKIGPNKLSEALKEAKTPTQR